jgi:hypothetical protein
VTAPFHLGLAVADLDAAMAELTAAFGIQWSEPIERQIADWRYRVVYSIEGPPHLELVSVDDGPADSPWDVTGGPRLDHAGWWIEDISAVKERLEALGMTVEFDLRDLSGGSAVYMRSPASGLRIELNNRRSRTSLYGRLGREAPEDG